MDIMENQAVDVMENIIGIFGRIDKLESDLISGEYANKGQLD